MSTVRMRNLDTKAEADVPESAVPILRASNWDLVPDAEVKAAERDRADELAATDLAMTRAGQAAIPTENPPTESSDESDESDLAEGRGE